LITSLSNSLVKAARLLRQRKARAETGEFLVEGVHHVGAALEAGWPVRAILFAPDLLTSEYAGELLVKAQAQGLRVESVSPPVMSSLADKENPQGLLAVVAQRSTELAGLHPSARCVALVSPQDPGNVGTILRTLDAVGGGALFLLDGGVDPYHPTAVRASMGCLFWVPVVQTSSDEFAGWAQRHALQLIGTSAQAQADYRTITPRPPWGLALGSEQKGLPAHIRDLCETNVSLPMRGHSSSLNLAAAAAVLLYQFA
jgi:TrmH family RNA methyltransferase